MKPDLEIARLVFRNWLTFSLSHRERAGVRGWVFLAMGLLFSLEIRASSFDLSIPPQRGERFSSANYRMWVPDGAKTLRSVIIKQHGCGRDGLTHADDLQWQELARKWDSALMGTHFQSASTNCADWSNPDLGTGRALLEALRQFGARSKHAELENVPWVLWGHSGGAFWCHALTIRVPDRVAAVFLQSGAITVTNIPAARVPVWLNRGTNDYPAIIQRVDTAFKMHRAMQAAWVLSVDSTSQYECGQSRLIAIQFFDNILGMRLPVPAPADGQAELIAMTSANAWLGDPASHEISPGAMYKENSAAACWFPNEKLAKLWKEFCSTGTIKDQTPPQAPTQLKAVASEGVMLTWSATADLDSGIKTFNVYRDGEKVGSYRGGGDATTGTGFQSYNAADEPEPPSPKMRFVDLAPPKGKHVYEVTTVNGAGLESQRSAGIEARVR